MEAKILRPLLWFGLLEHRSEKISSGRFGEHHFYRKAELFDRLLAFDVQVDLSKRARHRRLRASAAPVIFRWSDEAFAGARLG
jgi:hypothetical protein